MLHGVIAKLGNRYLLTLDATDCVSGDTLTSSKAEAVTANEISRAIDTAAANMRRKLGESRSSIHRFDTPMFAENTGSLEALRSYSNARRLTSMGKWADSIPMFQRAIELDPKFAIGYADMASAYLNVGDHANQAAYLTKAYELRDSANEPDRFYIVAMYHDAVTGNAEEELRNFRTWTNLYPQNGTARANMANLYTQLGQAESAIAPAKRDLELNPDSAVSYVILGRALLHAGQLKAAQSICGQAISKGLDGDDLHSLLLQADIALNDEAAVAGQIEWGRSHPSATRMRLNEGLLAFSRGRIQQGQDIFAAVASSYKEQGITRLYAVHLLASSRILAETGHLKEARKLLDTQLAPDGVMDPLVAMAK